MRSSREPCVQLVLEDDARGLAIDTRAVGISLRPRRRAARPAAGHATQPALGLERAQALVAHRDRERERAPRRPSPTSRAACRHGPLVALRLDRQADDELRRRPARGTRGSRITTSSSSVAPRLTVDSGRAIPIPASATASPIRFDPRSTPRMRLTRATPAGAADRAPGAVERNGRGTEHQPDGTGSLGTVSEGDSSSGNEVANGDRSHFRAATRSGRRVGVGDGPGVVSAGPASTASLITSVTRASIVGTLVT